MSNKVVVFSFFFKEYFIFTLHVSATLLPSLENLIMWNEDRVNVIVQAVKTS